MQKVVYGFVLTIFGDGEPSTVSLLLRTVEGARFSDSFATGNFELLAYAYRKLLRNSATKPSVSMHNNPPSPNDCAQRLVFTQSVVPVYVTFS